MSSNEQVITPGGPRPRDQVHFVTPGESVSGSAIVPDTTAVFPSSAPEGTDDMVLTPGGFRHTSLVHPIEAGHSLDVSTGEVIKRDPLGQAVGNLGPIKERPGNNPLMPKNVFVPPGKIAPFASGWISYADWTNNAGSPVSLFVATWTVPAAPSTQSGQTVFLFNGIQNSTMIYQPVLQWGPSAAGGGNYWAIASWYADGQGGPAYHSQLTQVQPGTKLIGVMALTSQSGAQFSYQCQFIGYPNSILPINNVQQLTWLILTLEAYNIKKATDYPTSSTAFTNIAVQTGAIIPNPRWTAVNAVTDAGQHTVVVSDAYGDGEVIIYY